MTACDTVLMDDRQRERLDAAQAAVDAALKRHEEALAARDTRMVEVRDGGVAVSAMARAIGLDRTRVQSIVGPAEPGRARGGEPTDEQADELRSLQAEVVAAEIALGRRKGPGPSVFDRRGRVFVELEAEGVGPFEQAEHLGMHRMNVQLVLDSERRARRRAAAAAAEIPTQDDAPGE